MSLYVYRASKILGLTTFDVLQYFLFNIQSYLSSHFHKFYVIFMFFGISYTRMCVVIYIICHRILSKRCFFTKKEKKKEQTKHIL